MMELDLIHIDGITVACCYQYKPEVKLFCGRSDRFSLLENIMAQDLRKVFEESQDCQKPYCLRKQNNLILYR